MDMEKIEALAALLARYDLGEIEVEQEGLKVKVAAKTPTIAAAPAATPPAPAEAAPASDAPDAAEPEGNLVLSPIVGTFYAASSPDREPFVTVGQRVKKGDVLFIVESMKLMNEIQSEFDGEVVRIFCDDGQTVEFNQPIMLIR